MEPGGVRTTFPRGLGLHFPVASARGPVEHAQCCGYCRNEEGCCGRRRLSSPRARRRRCLRGGAAGTLGGVTAEADQKKTPWRRVEAKGRGNAGTPTGCRRSRHADGSQRLRKGEAEGEQGRKARHVPQRDQPMGEWPCLHRLLLLHPLLPCEPLSPRAATHQLSVPDPLLPGSARPPARGANLPRAATIKRSCKRGYLHTHTHTL